MCINQFATNSREQVIYDDIDPFSKPPESKMKYPTVLLFVYRTPFLLAVIWNNLNYERKRLNMADVFIYHIDNLIPQLFDSSEDGTSSNKPAISQLPLKDITWTDTFYK